MATFQSTTVTLRRQSRESEVGSDDGKTFRSPFELMGACLPSAEVQRRSPGQEVLQTGKRQAPMKASASGGASRHQH